MDINTIGSIASILSLILAIVITAKVVKIDKSINSKETNQLAKGSKNIQAGKNVSIKK